MKKAMLMTVATIGLMSSSAFARVFSQNMTCAETRSLVQSRGAVVIYYEHSARTGNWLYDRYVAHQGYCMGGEVTQPAWIPTSDSSQCFVGYTCEQRQNGGNN